MTTPARPQRLLPTGPGITAWSPEPLAQRYAAALLLLSGITMLAALLIGQHLQDHRLHNACRTLAAQSQVKQCVADIRNGVTP